MTYREKLLDPRWQRMRLKTMERDEWKCLACGAEDKTLNVHHIRYTGAEPWDEESGNLETLCGDCHKMSHACRKYLMLAAKNWKSKNLIRFVRAEMASSQAFDPTEEEIDSLMDMMADWVSKQ